MRMPVDCANLNHRRGDAPVRFCPKCGEIVNAGVAAWQCAEAKHAAARRNQDHYCVDCGQRLIGGTP